MADIRIKDITTTASASLTGDFLPIDGSTGTRKLSAFSPTFGGNATVTGTLTVNGAATLSATGTNTIAGVLQFSNATPYLFPNAADKTLTIYGSSNANVGLTLYGDTHATKASQAEFIGSTLVRVLATTASTTTSTGALVVGNGTSGGLGVGGAMYIGGLIECSSASGIRIRTASGTAASFAVIQTGNATWEFKSPASDSSLVLRANDTTNALQLTNVGNGIFAGSVSTAAPSGGTSAAWKLGTVATVSPTSPNRTIEVDIGGTIYYIHAKTTNN